jgi:hypothetical protein
MSGIQFGSCKTLARGVTLTTCLRAVNVGSVHPIKPLASEGNSRIEFLPKVE